MATYKFVNADQLDSDLTQIGDAIRAKGGTTQSLAFPDEMVSAIAAISTGVELNFDVVAYATEEELLAATPKENTIGIITTTGISSWVFSATEPTEPVEGMVWFPTGTESAVEFNALKKNGIQVYPLSAKQYVGGAWVEVTAMSYQGGEWVAWIEIIDFDLTSWTFKNPYPLRDNTLGTYDLSNKTLKGYVTGSYQHVVMVKNEKIDCSSAGKLKFVYSLDKDVTDQGAVIVKLSSSNSDPTDATCVVNQQIATPATNQELAIDVSAVNSSYYLWIGLVMWGSVGTVNFEVSKLHLREV